MSHAFQVVPLVERTAAWWEWRRSGVGSSDAATILDAQPCKSVERLLREKQEAPQKLDRNFARARSAALERAARASYRAITGRAVEPACLQSLARPWQRASLDGITPDGEHVVEIKCGQSAYQRAATRQRPPRNHFAQLQHILVVTGLPVVDYYCYFPGHTPLRLEVKRDQAYIERLVAAEEVFWRRLPVAAVAQPSPPLSF